MQNAILAGMPVPMWVLTEVGKARLSSISFFLMGLLLSALAMLAAQNKYISNRRRIAGRVGRRVR